MKTNHRVNLEGEAFTKKLKVDDIMDVPEFFTAYVERMSGDQTMGFPKPKYKPERAEKGSGQIRQAERTISRSNANIFCGKTRKAPVVWI